MGIMITHHGYNNFVYNEHKNMGVHYTQQYMIIPAQISSPNFLLISPLFNLLVFPHPDADLVKDRERQMQRGTSEEQDLVNFHESPQRSHGEERRLGVQKVRVGVGLQAKERTQEFQACGEKRKGNTEVPWYSSLIRSRTHDEC